MAPYKVDLIPPKGDRLDLVVAFDGSKTVSDPFKSVMPQRSAKQYNLASK
jgi:hypothetical protein